ncbi:hypothetical protein [Gemella sanguinis]|uniref:hypothetical protein n=1 Tax=Gemella sanguinis TaxID=84135 RepID=UPI0028D3EF59|nr:hypothetical protein [Gemella sanguinis]
MSRKNFLILAAIETLLITVTFILESVFNNKLWYIAGIIIMIFIFLHTSYLLIVKKSINLLAGMTEEEAIEIRKDPDKLKKHEKIAQVIGIVFLLSIFFLIYLIYEILG